jgi:hypothetical protein
VEEGPKAPALLAMCVIKHNIDQAVQKTMQEAVLLVVLVELVSSL